MDAHINAIARRHLDLETLETRNSDDLDFREQAVWNIAAALKEAYELGRSDERLGVKPRI